MCGLRHSLLCKGDAINLKTQNSPDLEHKFGSLDGTDGDGWEKGRFLPPPEILRGRSCRAEEEEETLCAAATATAMPMPTASDCISEYRRHSYGRRRLAGRPLRRYSQGTRNTILVVLGGGDNAQTERGKPRCDATKTAALFRHFLTQKFTPLSTQTFL